MEMKINAEKVVKERKARAWSQQHLADASTLSLRTIQRVENNGAGSPETVKALASCFELDVNELFISETQKAKSYLKAKVAALFSLLIALGSSLFLTPVSMASGISISAQEMEAPANKNFQIFRRNVEIFIPESVAFDISTDSLWESESAPVAEGSIEIKIKDSTVYASRAIIIKMDEGIKITTDYAEHRFSKTD